MGGVLLLYQSVFLYGFMVLTDLPPPVTLLEKRAAARFSALLAARQ
jgi:hypothetical protein